MRAMRGRYRGPTTQHAHALAEPPMPTPHPPAARPQMVYVNDFVQILSDENHKGWSLGQVLELYQTPDVSACAHACRFWLCLLPALQRMLAAVPVPHQTQGSHAPAGSLAGSGCRAPAATTRKAAHVRSSVALPHRPFRRPSLPPILQGRRAMRVQWFYAAHDKATSMLYAKKKSVKGKAAAEDEEDDPSLAESSEEEEEEEEEEAEEEAGEEEEGRQQRGRGKKGGKKAAPVTYHMGACASRSDHLPACAAPQTDSRCPLRVRLRLACSTAAAPPVFACWLPGFGRRRRAAVRHSRRHGTRPAVPGSDQCQLSACSPLPPFSLPPHPPLPRSRARL